MRIITLLTLCLVGCQAQKRNIVPFLLNEDNSYPCGKKMGMYCHTCTSIKLCFNNNLVGGPMECSDLDKEMPFCNPITNNCEKEEICQGSESDFKCEQVGSYPDPSSCTRYIICSTASEFGSYYSCMPNEVYDHRRGCVRSGTCFNYVNLCRNRTVLLAHPFDKTIYVECKGVGQKPVLQSCPSESVFNVNKEKCEFSCSKVGRFADPSSKIFFYFCMKVGNTFTQFRFACPPGQEFDSKIELCKPKPAPVTTQSPPTKPTEQTSTKPTLRTTEITTERTQKMTTQSTSELSTSRTAGTTQQMTTQSTSEVPTSRTAGTTQQMTTQSTSEVPTTRTAGTTQQMTTITQIPPTQPSTKTTERITDIITVTTEFTATT